MNNRLKIFAEDHARGLSTFTIMAGLGGFMGYGLGGINWDATSLGVVLGGHLHVTFTLVTIIFVVCVLCTITSFKEIPLEVLERDQYRQIDPPNVSSPIRRFLLLIPFPRDYIIYLYFAPSMLHV